MSKNVWLTKNAKVESLKEALPSFTGFVVNTKSQMIEYAGNPAAIKFYISPMTAVVETLDGFERVETPKTYVDKNTGITKSTKVVSFSYTDADLASILVDNINRLVVSEYEEYKKNKENKENKKSKSK